MNPEKEDKWVIPSALPIADLRGKDLEECVFWLLDGMGAKDLQWRVGGTGGGAADGGRDLEATFFTSQPDGEMEPQTWWIECKGRKGTLEKEAVTEAVNNSTVRADLAQLIIVTNTTFSNPTRDWVAEWQKSHPRPKIRLWDASSLERMLSKHPSVVLRISAQALSVEGQLRAIQERFWNRMEYSSEQSLETVWLSRDQLTIDGLQLASLIVNEFAVGDIAKRPWAATVPKLEAITGMLNVVKNLPFLLFKRMQAGVNEDPIIKAAAYLLHVSLLHFDHEAVDRAIFGELTSDGAPFPDEVLKTLLFPMVGELWSDMQDLCSADCDRFMGGGKRSRTRADQPDLQFWSRFEKNPARDTSDGSWQALEYLKGECKVGFYVSEANRCPLFKEKLKLDNLATIYSIIDKVTGYRLAQARSRTP